MTMRRTALAAAGLLLLAACGTSVEAHHMRCMDDYADFPNQFACVQNTVGNDPYLRGDPLMREYLLTGEGLLAELRAGRISDESARLQFLQKLNEIRRIELEQMAHEAQIRRDMERRFPRHTTCVPDAGGRTVCTTY